MCFWKHKILKLEKIDPEIVYKVLKVSTRNKNLNHRRIKDNVLAMDNNIMIILFD